MKAIVRISVVFLILLQTVSTNAQNKLHFGLDWSYLQGVSEKGDLWHIKSGLSGFDLSLTGMYDINKRLSAGIGVGVEKLYDPAYTIFPVFTKIVYSPLRSSEKPFIFTKIGYGIGSNISNAGFLFNPGLGYKFPLRQHFAICVLLGYHLQSVRYEINSYSSVASVVDSYTSHNNRHSISLGVGLVF